MIRNELKTLSKIQMKGNWGLFALATLIIAIISGTISGIAGVTQLWAETNPALTIVVCIVLAVVSIVLGTELTYGYYKMFLMQARGEKVGLGMLFDNFSKVGKTFLLSIICTIIVLVFTILLVVPGIIAGLVLAQVFYILIDQPELGIMEILRRSAKLMSGHKWEFFKLSLSFILWVLLTGITFGIASFWVGPYMEQTFANYYLYLKGELDTKVN